MTERRNWLAERLRVVGKSQHQLAKDVGVHPNTPGRWVRGEQNIRPRYRPKLAEAVQMSLEELDQEETAYLRSAPAERPLPGGVVDPAVPAVADTWDLENAGRLAEAVTAQDELQITPEMAPRLVHEWLVVKPPQSVELAAGRRIGADLVDRVGDRVNQLRHLDDFVAGADLERAVRRELAATAQLVREASYGDTVGRHLLGVLGDLCQLAGWVTADAGHDRWASHYYATGIAAAHAAGDRPLAGQLASTLAYHLANTGRARDAVLLAQSAITGSQDAATATAQALFLERLAWSYARSGDTRSAEQTLAAVESTYAHRAPNDDPPWAYWLTADEVDVMAGRCWVELHQPDRARPRLESALAGYGDDRAREAALYASWLAEAHLQAGDVEQAAHVASRVLDLTTHTASVRSDDRARHLHRLFRPYRGVPAVQDFNNRYRSEFAT